jgi:uncharacterized protein (DUF1697 family)
MEQLRKAFEVPGFSDVSTFIASGNVVFTSAARNAARLELRVEAALQTALGYPVATFIRSAEELTHIAQFQPFRPDPAAEGGAIYIIFLSQAPTPAARAQLLAFNSAADEFAVNGREVYWCRRGKLLESTIDGVAIDRVLGRVPTTTRNRNTILRLVKKLGA